MSYNKAITLTKLSKCYQIYDSPRNRLVGPLSNKIRSIIGLEQKSYYTEHWALKDINYSIDKGDSVGVIGRNGAGKSTLLQILAGTLIPTNGDISIHGRVAALLELGAGFNPEFSGHDNIYMNASILGLSKDEINESYRSIVEFADIGDFLHQPIKTYSSGMYVRLAFAIAANVEPDVLIIDEALAVGDIRFQLKCLERMNELKSKGTTILFVSHSPEQVKRFCNKAIWIDGGVIREQGSSNEVCDKYNDYMCQVDSVDADVNDEKSIASSPAKILNTTLNSYSLKTGSKLIVTIEYEVNDEVVDGLLAGVALYSSDRKYLFGINTDLDNMEIANNKGIHRIDYVIEKLPLLPGSYGFDIGLMGQKSLIGFDYKTEAVKLQVYNDYKGEGIFYIEHHWSQNDKGSS
ncbi:ABC transporter ATP-binding protein [Vibrio sp. McD22-P3]|uniref:ABC transporter ATP-binding protein n=1 Tax=Vibrio sp. McD22-P3 TaxID=2724880 RepID=UPI001F48BBBD|nr:ABC transporter ATP-binding protein [Vibrio sp. McD22-P3]MCF4175274.1 ABC transporter ATP-binding protein [Vibrio sp. McD22-P3]